MQKYACPCCGHRTLTEYPPGTYQICPVCFWEDDGVQFRDPDLEGGANRPSLRQAQKHFREHGVCEDRLKPFVRPPAADEPRKKGWTPLPQPDS
jgi:Cysteine-rich CPCC